MSPDTEAGAGFVFFLFVCFFSLPHLNYKRFTFLLMQFIIEINIKDDL